MSGALNPGAWEPQRPINAIELPRCQYQRRIGSAAAKCSNQADLHLAFIDPDVAF